MNRPRLAREKERRSESGPELLLIALNPINHFASSSIVNTQVVCNLFQRIFKFHMGMINCNVTFSFYLCLFMFESLWKNRSACI